jgi:hypothetical protein
MIVFPPYFEFVFILYIFLQLLPWIWNQGDFFSRSSTTQIGCVPMASANVQWHHPLPLCVYLETGFFKHLMKMYLLLLVSGPCRVTVLQLSPLTCKMGMLDTRTVNLRKKIMDTFTICSNLVPPVFHNSCRGFGLNLNYNKN